MGVGVLHPPQKAVSHRGPRSPWEENDCDFSWQPPAPADPRAIPVGFAGGEGEDGTAQVLLHQRLKTAGVGRGSPLPSMSALPSCLTSRPPLPDTPPRPEQVSHLGAPLPRNSASRGIGGCSPSSLPLSESPVLSQQLPSPPGRRLGPPSRLSPFPKESETCG